MNEDAPEVEFSDYIRLQLLDNQHLLKKSRPLILLQREESNVAWFRFVNHENEIAEFKTAWDRTKLHLAWELRAFHGNDVIGRRWRRVSLKPYQGIGQAHTEITVDYMTQDGTMLSASTVIRVGRLP